MSKNANLVMLNSYTDYVARHKSYRKKKSLTNPSNGFKKEERDYDHDKNDLKA